MKNVDHKDLVFTMNLTYIEIEQKLNNKCIAAKERFFFVHME